MRVDFYILATTKPEDRLHFACRLTEKAYGLNSRVYAHMASANDAQQLDKMLWTFRQDSFIPHDLLTGEAQNRAPVCIGTRENHLSEGELLVNLDTEMPNFAKGFARIAEIIGGDESSRQVGRERFKQYRELGIEPETHQIGT
jgi:DNA polymerase-3 subunit chi